MTANGQFRSVPLLTKVSALLSRQYLTLTYFFPILMLVALAWYREFYVTEEVSNLSFWVFMGLSISFGLVLRYGPIGRDLIKLINYGGLIAGECTAIDLPAGKSRSGIRILTFIYEVKGRRYQLQLPSRSWRRFEIDGEYLILYELDDPYQATVPLSYSKSLHNFLANDVKIV